MPGCTYNAPGFSLAGLTNDNLDSSLAFAAHLGLHLPVGHTPQPGRVCISLILRPPEDKGVALTTLLKEWLDRPNATKEEFASLLGKMRLTANGVFAGCPSLKRVLANERRAGTRACKYALTRFIPAPPPAHRHDFDISDLKLLAHPLVVRVGDPRPAQRLKTPWSHALGQVSRGSGPRSSRSTGS